MPDVRAPRLLDGRLPVAVAGLGIALCAAATWGQPLGLDGLATLTPGRTKAENALWIENPLTAQFKTSKRVVVADLKGPAVITMVQAGVSPHFRHFPATKGGHEARVELGILGRYPRGPP